MQYCITMERVQRVAVQYEANSDDEAITQGESIFHNHVDENKDLHGGTSEYFFEVCQDNGRVIVQWD